MKYQYNNPIWLIINYLSSDLYLRYDRFLSWYRNFPSYIQDLWGQFCSRDKRSKLLHESPAILEIQEIILHNVVVPGAEYFVSTCGCDHLDPARNFAGQPVDLVGVLTLGEFSIQKRNIIVGFVLENFNSLPPSGLGLAGFSHGVKLSHCKVWTWTSSTAWLGQPPYLDTPPPSWAEWSGTPSSAFWRPCSSAVITVSGIQNYVCLEWSDDQRFAF